VTAVLVPVKGFESAKARLAGVIGGGQRSTLARSMAERVLYAARPLPVWVVCDDPAVAAWAVSHGAGVCWRQVPGLNAAVTAGVAFLSADGVERVVVVHADLPRAHRLDHLLDGPADEVVLVPDRHRDGSNVLVVPASAGFRFAYGPGSFTAHSVEARRVASGLRVVDDADLAWDVDVADDLPALDGSPVNLEDP
jgi:2-phospho-L-lactate/phosphoenolpyruvate guanylyltransferase